MVDRFVSYATGPAMTPGQPGAVIRIDGEGGTEMVNLIWGFAPPAPGARPLTYLRSEGRSFASRRCLVPGSQFSISSGQGSNRRKWRVMLAGKDTHFYFAAIWRPAEADWPPSYAMITVAAGPDVAPIQGRQVAVIWREDAAAWLNHLAPEAKLLAAHPKGTFRLEQTEEPRLRQAAFGW